jgi:hypothetical protein
VITSIPQRRSQNVTFHNTRHISVTPFRVTLADLGKATADSEFEFLSNSSEIDFCGRFFSIFETLKYLDPTRFKNWVRKPLGDRVCTRGAHDDLTETLVGRRPDNGLSAMGAWNPHAGLVYRPPTRTPTSMLCASSSVRTEVPFISQPEPDAHPPHTKNSTYARPPDIHKRPHPALPVRMSPYYVLNGSLTVTSSIFSPWFHFFFHAALS